MPRVYKISMFLALIAVMGAITHFALAQGQGYFLEKGKELFIFDNINIRGYLAIEPEASDIAGSAGDVLVANQFVLANDSAFNFCKDTRAPQTNLPQNMNCDEKVMVWQPSELEVINPDFSKLNANKIIATSQISLQANQKVTADAKVRVIGDTRCLVNDGTTDCNLLELKTQKLYLQNLSSLDDPANNIDIRGDSIDFGNIDFGSETNRDNQQLCWLTSGVCPNGANGNSYKDANFQDISIASMPNTRVCCFLNVTNF